MIESFVVVTVPANGLVGRIDNVDGRMPAILRRKDYATWLSGTPVRAKAVLHEYPDKWMRAHAVSPRVNSPSQDDAELIRPVA